MRTRIDVNIICTFQSIFGSLKKIAHNLVLHIIFSCKEIKESRDLVQRSPDFERWILKGEFTNFENVILNDAPR